jgi:hypothetical protein
LVKEHPYQSFSLKGEWNFLAKESGWPDLVHYPLMLSLLMIRNLVAIENILIEFSNPLTILGEKNIFHRCTIFPFK